MPDPALLEKYADVAVQIGLGLGEGDRLLVRSSTDAVGLTRLIVERAYAAGAVNVEVLWADDQVSRARFSHGKQAASETIASLAGYLMHSFEKGDFWLTIDAKDPAALAGQDLSRVGRFQKKQAQHLEPVYGAMSRLDMKWSIIAAPTPAWAARVFPGSDPEEAVEQLWAAIFRACRVDRADPIGDWLLHMANLDKRKRALNAGGYRALRYEAPGTDLTLGLPDSAVWVGGSVQTPDGRRFAPNIPTEEVFTSPHRLKADGIVTATKPLSLFGNMVSGFSLELSEGMIVGAHAESGQEALDQLLSTDDGSMRLGETAMVPMSSAVAAERLVWSNTLYDENDGCHIAIGRAYPLCVEGGVGMGRDELRDAGLNVSTTHVDFVVGSSDLTVYGVAADGSEEPIIESGEWAFDID